MSLNIAQLSTMRPELPWLHFSLGATLAFLVFCFPWSPEEAFWRRPRGAPLACLFPLQSLGCFYVDVASPTPAARRPGRAVSSASPLLPSSSLLFFLSIWTLCRMPPSRDLQDWHTFAPITLQKFSKVSSNVLLVHFQKWFLQKSVFHFWLSLINSILRLYQNFATIFRELKKYGDLQNWWISWNFRMN